MSMGDGMDPGEDLDQAAMADAWEAALREQQAQEEPAHAQRAGGAAPRPLDPEEFTDGFESSSASGEVNMKMILDVPVTIAMEIGRTRIPIRNLLQLNQGSVVELDRLAGSPLDVLVNGTLIAHGEVVVVNEKYGIRLTDVISPSERVRKLK